MRSVLPLSLASLAVALLVPFSKASAQGTGTPAAPAAAVEEKAPTTIDAERMDGVGELELTARGAAEVRQDETVIFGEVLRINREFGRVEADGGARMQRGTDRFFGPSVRYNLMDGTGVFESPTFLIQRDAATSRGSAESIEFAGPGRYRLRQARYTTCEPGQEDWMLEASELDLDFPGEEGRAKHPRLRFFDTTVMAAPFAAFPLEQRRKSGLLAPYYASNSRRGLEFGVPYYWNIAPESDATITPVLMTRRGMLLKNELRYLDRDYRGELRYELMPEDQVLSRARKGISLQHEHNNLAPGVRARIDYNRVSDDRYFVDLASAVRQVSTGNLQQDAYLTYNGSLAGQAFGALARIQKFQTLQDPLAPITPPYQRVPQLNIGATRNDIAGLLDLSLPAEFVRFSHVSQVEGSRVLLQPSIASPQLAPGWFVTPRAGLRQVNYALDRTAAGQPRSPGVTIPWFSVDSGLVFDREANWFGETLTQTLEPRAYYVYVPYRNQDAIPVFDTGLSELSFPQLFSENRFGGGDRFGDANQLTLAVTSRFLQAGGQESFRATIGQRVYFQDERVGLTPASTLRTNQTSDLLASVGGRVFRHATFDATMQYDPHQGRPQRYSVSTRYAPEIAKTVTASYRFNRDTIRQIDVSGQWPVAPGWFAVGRYNYSFRDSRLLEGIAGLEYNAGCWVFRFVAQRLQAATQVASTAVYVQLELRGVGELGTDEALNLLKRNIAGYSVTNPVDPTLAPPSLQRRLPFQQVF